MSDWDDQGQGGTRGAAHRHPNDENCQGLRDYRAGSQKHGSTISYGWRNRVVRDVFFGMFADMLIGVSPVDWRLATAFVVVSISSWLFGGWFLWARRSLLKTVRSESGVLAAGSPTVAVKIGSQG